MITKKTVIVVGAGASKDLSFPLGYELQKGVADILAGSDPKFDEYFYPAVQLALANNSARAEVAFKACRRYAYPLRSASSVDNFLDQHKYEAEFVRATKLAIAYLIAKAEHSSQLGKRYLAKDLLESTSQYFMLDLLNMLIRGHQIDNLKSSIDNLTFVIFNYDRAVERYFREWLQMRFGDAGPPLLSNANFIHVYGSLGDYFDSKVHDPFTHGGTEPFLNLHLDLAPYAERIKVFTEQEDSEIADRITNAVHVAEALIFLGFGFEEQNMRFFKPSANPKKVFSTLMKVTSPNVDFVLDLLSRRFDSSRDVKHVNGTAKTLFDEFRFNIGEAVGSLPN